MLYPMNALANDQLKRLRALLKDYPEITFGRYTGETKPLKNDARDYFKSMNPGQEILPNELLSREEMRDNPPNILITNYAMLEYLLLRPEDNMFFDGPYRDEWKYVVLDEAHIYSGALGSEISYLIARLKDRVADGQKGKLKFIATSATLGGGEKEIDNVVSYAEDLFGEDFTKDCLITSERVATYKRKAMVKPDKGWYTKFLKIANTYTGKELRSKINENEIYNSIDEKTDDEEILYDALIQDYYVNRLKTVIENKTMLLHEVVKEVFGNDSGENRTSFLALLD